MGEPARAKTWLGVLGWPVDHSRSPALQNAALRASGLAGWRYGRLPVAPELFDETVRALPDAGFRAVNVTIPYKERALGLADTATRRAREIGAANALMLGGAGERDEPGGGRKIHADNTDAPGLIACLPESPVGLRALVLGAGGSARAAVWALLDGGAQEVFVWNRNPERAARLCAELGGTPVTAPDGWGRGAGRERPGAGGAILDAGRELPGGLDLLVNCTPVGLGERDSLASLPVPAGRLDTYKAIVDFVYRDGGTVLSREARRRSVPIVEGLELLVAQGALSFELFTGIPAPVATMRAAVGLA